MPDPKDKASFVGELIELFYDHWYLLVIIGGCLIIAKCAG